MKRPGIMWKGVALLAGLAEARAQEFSRSVISVLGDPPPGAWNMLPFPTPFFHGLVEQLAFCFRRRLRAVG